MTRESSDAAREAKTACPDEGGKEMTLISLPGIIVKRERLCHTPAMTSRQSCTRSFFPLWSSILLLLSIGGFPSATAYTPASSSNFRNRVARFSNSPSFLNGSKDMTTSTTAAAPTKAVTPQYWDFQGHQCYAEVAYPDVSAFRPRTPSEAAGRFLFGGEAAEVLQSYGKFSASTTTSRGTKRPEIVLIHGFGCSTVYWRETRKALTKAGYTVHALDLLGQGKSAKPGRADNVEYSIDLWAKMVEDYTRKFIPSQNRVVVIGNSLGSVVALSAATGDHAAGQTKGRAATLPSRIQGVGMFNCGVGMNSRNLLKDPNLNAFQRTLFTFLFDTLDKLIFDNVPLLTYLLEDVVTKDLLRNALLGLYRCSPDPESRVDEALVDSFYLPAKDKGSVEALNQIYTNDAGKTPMELHEEYGALLNKVPLHLVWGTEDQVTPLQGPVGQFYLDLVKNPKGPVSVSIVEGGHIPFDEIPDCNGFMVQWLEDVVLAYEGDEAAVTGSSFGGLFTWPFAGKSAVPVQQ